MKTHFMAYLAMGILLISSSSSFAEEDIAFFSDDVTLQSEKEMCNPLCSVDEQKLTTKLDPETLRLYNSLDSKGKLRAIEMAKTYKDKNEAVRIAAKEMAHRQSEEYPFQNDYQEQMDESARLKPYRRRYGY